MDGPGTPSIHGRRAADREPTAPHGRRAADHVLSRRASDHALSVNLGPLLASVTTIEERAAPAAARRRDAIYRGFLVGADALAATITAWSAGLASEGGVLPVLLLVLAVLVLAEVLGLYERDELLLHKGTLDEIPAFVQLATLATLATWIADDLVGRGRLDAASILVALVVLVTGLTVLRIVARAGAKALTPCERCLFIGDRESYERVSSKLTGRHHDHAEIVAHLSLDEGDGGLDSAQLFGALEDLRQLVARIDAHRIILAPTVTESAAVLEVIRMAKAVGVKVSLVPRMLEVVGSSVVFDSLEGISVLALRRFGLSRGAEITKRGYDVVVGSLMLVVLLPLLAAIALAIRLGSPGPALFRQTRVGRGGRRFCLYKFRTMVADAESRKPELHARNEADGLFKVADDPRTTRIGRFLRRTSLDELPQLINVMRGEMSLVGPRPLILEEDGRISGWQRRRLDLTPGMTGQWQVLGSARIPMQEMVKIDYLYVTNWSLWVDVKIMLRTLGYMLARRNL